MQAIGNYTINKIEKLGQGGFGSVYKGHLTTNPSMKVAIKVLNTKTMQCERKYIEGEIKALLDIKKSHHKNLIKIIWSSSIIHEVFLVMEFCNGGDLQRYLNTVGILSEDTIRLFVKQIVSGLKVIFGLGIVHRDLKPQNILVSYDDKYGSNYPVSSKLTLKISDFGLSKYVGNSLMSFVGTPRYMAPEMKWSKNYDNKVDLWSLGIIIFNCLAGKMPFTEPSPKLNLSTVIPPQTSSNLKNLIKGLLKYSAEDRMNFNELKQHPFIQNQQHNQLAVNPPTAKPPAAKPPAAKPPAAKPLNAKPPAITPLDDIWSAIKNKIVVDILPVDILPVVMLSAAMLPTPMLPVAMVVAAILPGGPLFMFPPFLTKIEPMKPINETNLI